MHQTQAPRYKNSSTPSLCGDSAWWFVSDGFDPGENTYRPEPLPRFSPILITGHSLQTSQGSSFPKELPLSGLAQFWNMVCDHENSTEELCTVRGFVDTGMTMVHAPNSWGI